MERQQAERRIPVEYTPSGELIKNMFSAAFERIISGESESEVYSRLAVLVANEIDSLDCMWRVFGSRSGSKIISDFIEAVKYVFDRFFSASEKNLYLELGESDTAHTVHQKIYNFIRENIHRLHESPPHEESEIDEMARDIANRIIVIAGKAVFQGLGIL